jgi:5-methylcytosine-specific restriction endonuclease McrA
MISFLLFVMADTKKQIQSLTFENIELKSQIEVLLQKITFKDDEIKELNKENKNVKTLIKKNDTLTKKIKELEQKILEKDEQLNSFIDDTRLDTNPTDNLSEAMSGLVVEKKPKKKNIKDSIPKTVKIVVWNKWIGEDIGATQCLCCKSTKITQMAFHCGHIISEKDGGKATVDNLKPICSSCNLSMATENMDDFIKRNGF